MTRTGSAGSTQAPSGRDLGTELRRLFSFTRAETNIALLLTEGLSYAEIAEHLGLSYHTVYTHVKAIHEKAGVSTTGRHGSSQSHWLRHRPTTFTERKAPATDSLERNPLYFTANHGQLNSHLAHYVQRRTFRKENPPCQPHVVPISSSPPVYVQSRHGVRS